MTEFEEKCEYYGVPEHNWQGLELYLKHGIEPGGFLRAVLENDLLMAVQRADRTNREALKEICLFVANELPGEARGSKLAVEYWLHSFKTGEKFC